MLAIALAAFGFWNFFVTLPSIPELMFTESGTVAMTEARTYRGSIGSIRIQVVPSGKEFIYPSALGRADWVRCKLAAGQSIEVQYTNPNDPQLWGLRVAGETLITPNEAYAARRSDGYLWLVVGIFGLGYIVLQGLFAEKAPDTS